MKRYFLLLCISWTFLVGLALSEATGTTLLTTTTLSSSLPSHISLNHPLSNSTTVFQNITLPWSICKATEISCALPGGGNNCCPEGFVCTGSGPKQGQCVVSHHELGSCSVAQICTPQPTTSNPFPSPICCPDGLNCLHSSSFAGTCILASSDVGSCPPSSICVPKAGVLPYSEALCCAQDEVCTEVGCGKETGSTGPNEMGTECDADGAFVTLPEPSCCAKRNVCTFTKDGNVVTECCKASESCTWMGCENLQFAVPRRRLFKA